MSAKGHKQFYFEKRMPTEHERMRRKEIQVGRRAAIKDEHEYDKMVGAFDEVSPWEHPGSGNRRKNIC